MIILFVGLAAALTYTLIRIQSLRKALDDQRQKSGAVLVSDETEEKKAILRHDLKGTLNRIFALARLIPMSGPVNEAQQEYLSKIELQCSEGQEAVNRAIPKGTELPSS